jgi:hypothetical protein
MLRIGIDLDNTIACYDQAFFDVATLMGLITPDIKPSKLHVKAQVLSRPNGDLDWQRLQGQVYGKHMLRAKIYPGFLEFLCASKLRGYRVYIVSHKSEFGHFDDERISLRGQALRWLKLKKILDNSNLAIGEGDIFFEGTRAEKVNRISELKCTHFIDDLVEVFEEPAFPQTAQKVLFWPGSATQVHPTVQALASWREISFQMFGGMLDSEIKQVAQAKFPLLADLAEVELRKGRGNSKIYSLITASEKRYALKIYPDRQNDSRPRLETEFNACKSLHDRGYPVAEACAVDEDLGWGLFDWIHGAPIENPDDKFLADALQFVKRLNRDGDENSDFFDQFSLASEACLSGTELVRQIEARRLRLNSSESPELADYLEKEFSPQFILSLSLAKKALADKFNHDLPKCLQTLSTSDFGSHNAIRIEDGGTVFIDFEYFGLDDPVKLAADFFWHPGMRLSPRQRIWWIRNCADIFHNDSQFATRLRAYLPLYGLRWCLILLNEFVPASLIHRFHADPQRKNTLTSIRVEQLKKSRNLLHEVQEITYESG